LQAILVQNFEIDQQMVVVERVEVLVVVEVVVDVVTKNSRGSLHQE
jgi:hypothetical protein